MLRVTNKIYNIKLKLKYTFVKLARWKMKKEKGYHQGFRLSHTAIQR